MPRTVHVIFKTHLDVGFTDFAREVVRRYFEQYIPKAVELARGMRERGGDRFVWTTGSWLIYEYLERAAPAPRRAMEEAILAGDIRWHALPFTTHTELIDAGLYRFALGLSRDLDRRFGTATVAAKMTDVPGHTRGMVPLLAEAGVRFLHIGVNPACSPPAVPDEFRWRDPASGAEIVVVYDKGGYGGTREIAGSGHVMAFAHTGDNCGPQSEADIGAQFDRLRQSFPGCEVRASTLEAVAAAILPLAESLPVVESEIGDTWIHGGATDPLKIARFRALSLLRNDWCARRPDEAATPAMAAFSRLLLMVPEHTWGLDVKTHLGDYRHYDRAGFAAARQRDAVEEPVPEEYSYAAKFRVPAGGRYSRLEASWREQRRYLADAVKALGQSELAAEARRTLALLRPRRPARTGWHDVEAGAEMETGRFLARLDAQSGALIGLRQSDTGREVAGPAHPLALVRYQSFSQADFDRYLRQYAVNMEHAWIWPWAIPDLTKPGMAASGAESALWAPALHQARRRYTREYAAILAELQFPEAARQRYGAPEHVTIEYRFPHDESAVDIVLQWFDKSACRLPEAMWLSFTPRVAQPGGWRMDKMGSRVSPLDVISHGNRNLHAVQDGVSYRGEDGELRIETLDAPLVAPGAARLLHFDDSLPDLSGGMHFNLLNNIWGTNFPMWYEGDAKFRFRLSV